MYQCVCMYVWETLNMSIGQLKDCKEMSTNQMAV